MASTQACKESVDARVSRRPGTGSISVGAAAALGGPQETNL